MQWLCQAALGPAGNHNIDVDHPKNDAKSNMSDNASHKGFAFGGQCPYKVPKDESMLPNVTPTPGLSSERVCTESPAPAKKRVQLSDNALPAGLSGQCA